MTQSFEENTAPCQELSFDRIDSLLRSNLGNKRPRISGLKDNRGLFTNLAYMLSDQNPWCIEVVYRNTVQRMTGPLIAQIDDAMDAVTVRNPPVETKKKSGMYRRFPSIAVKECIVNAAIHSDLREGQTISITVRDDFLSILSPGRTYVPNEWKDIELTNPRNWGLAELLVRMKYASLKGRGMTVIRNCYTGSGLVPCIIQGQNTFEIRLPAVDGPATEPSTGTALITDYLKRRSGASMSDISHDLMVSVYQVRKLLDSMESDGSVFTMGIGSKRRAYLTKHAEYSETPESESVQIRD